MDFIYLILIAMANNIDNISVRISYSIRRVKISTLKNLWIAIITCFNRYVDYNGTILQ